MITLLLQIIGRRRSEFLISCELIAPNYHAYSANRLTRQQQGWNTQYCLWFHTARISRGIDLARQELVAATVGADFTSESNSPSSYLCGTKEPFANTETGNI